MDILTIMPIQTHLAVIGAGPGGYTAAFRAADLGLAVTLIDRDKNPGGACLFRGCIPSKALVHAAETLSSASDARTMGIEFAAPTINVEKLRTWKENIVSKLTSGLGQLTKQRNISFIQGNARFSSSTSLEITKADGTTDTLIFQKAIVATGSQPAALPGLPLTSRIWDSTEALALPCVPESLLVIGGGYIGLELGSAYAALGANVSVVDTLPQLFPSADRDLADVIIRRLKKKFKNILLNTSVIKADPHTHGITITFQDLQGQTTTEHYTQILVSVGRKPDIIHLGLEKTNVKINASGFIDVNAQRRTTDENIYAIGDITGQPMLAHKASAEAKIAVDAVIGQTTIVTPQAIPSVVFTDPELAWIGITETDAKNRHLDITVFNFPWAASGRALTINRTDGLTKIIADTQTRRILGVGIAGTGAGELIAEGALALLLGATADDLAATIHPHPTLSETVMETAEGLFGNSTHLLRPKRKAT